MENIKKHFKTSELIIFTVVLTIASAIGRMGQSSNKPSSAGWEFDVGYTIGIVMTAVMFGAALELLVAFYRLKKNALP